MVNMRAAREYKDGSLVTYVISCEAAIAWEKRGLELAE
jgi:hypothetical protein